MRLSTVGVSLLILYAFIFLRLGSTLRFFCKGLDDI